MSAHLIFDQVDRAIIDKVGYALYWPESRRTRSPEQLFAEDETRVDFDFWQLSEIACPEVCRAMRHAPARRGVAYSRAPLPNPKAFHRELLPDSFPELPGIRVGARCLPLEGVGGDVYCFAELPGGRGVRIMLADAMGHGVGAALAAARLVGMFHAAASQCVDIPQLLENLNRKFILAKCATIRFVTVFVADIFVGSQTVRYGSAGHGSAFVIGGSVDRSAHKQLAVSGLPIGISIAERYEVLSPVDLDTGEVLLVVSDGITEAHLPHGRGYFGSDGLIFPVVAKMQNCPDTSPEVICEAVLDALRLETEIDPGADRSVNPWLDDVSVLCVKRQ